MLKVKYNKEESKKIFFTSDTHFHHKNIIRYCKRPYSTVEEMDEALINNWNKVVPKDGIVFLLGDFCFGGSDKIKKLTKKLNGKIRLVKGNHDHISKGMERMFEYVTDELIIEVEKHRVYLNHYPFLTFAGSNSYAIQLFGHVHSGPYNNGSDKWRLKYLLPGQYDVGVDNNNFTPVSWKDIKEIIDKRRKHKKSIIEWVKSMIKEMFQSL